MTRDRITPSLAGMRRLSALLATAVLAPLVTLLPATSADAAGAHRRIAYEQWGSTRAFRDGILKGLVAGRGRLELAEGSRTRGRYDLGTWTSPWVEPGFGATEVIPSWSATTP